MNRLLGTLAVVALLTTAIAAPASANAPQNGHNCIGVAASWTEPGANGPRVAWWNSINPPGAMARRVVEVREDPQYGCATAA